MYKHLISLTLFLMGCQASTEPVKKLTAPSHLIYQPSEIVFVQGTDKIVHSAVPTVNSGGADSVSYFLRTFYNGISIHETTGVITIHSDIELGEYKLTVAVKNEVGSNTFVNAFQVHVIKQTMAPSDLKYQPNTIRFVKFQDTHLQSVIPQINTGGSPIRSYQLKTPYTGISIDTVTGQLSVSEEIEHGTYHLNISANNAVGSTEFRHIFTVTAIEPQNNNDTINIATWNLEWFYNSTKGPSDDALQFQNTKQLLNAFQLDLIGFEEISNTQKFHELAKAFSYYGSVLSNYNSSTEWLQNTGLFYNTNLFTYVSHTQIAEIYASRPPLKVALKKGEETIYIIVLHAKSGSGSSNYNKRLVIAQNLKNYIDTHHPNDFVIIMGDFNDMLAGSISSSNTSPYKNIVDASTDYLPVTYELNTTNTSEASGVWGNTIDHLILSNEFQPFFINGSVNVLKNEAEQIISNYLSTVSDHYPVKIQVIMN